MSITITGLIIELLTWLSVKFQINLPQAEIDGFVKTIVALVGFGLIWWGRYRKGDITPIGSRK